MAKYGSEKDLVSKIAGGAQMFQIKTESNILQIGKEMYKQLKIS